MERKCEQIRGGPGKQGPGPCHVHPWGQLSFNEQLEPTVQDLRIASAHLTLAQKGQEHTEAARLQKTSSKCIILLFSPFSVWGVKQKILDSKKLRPTIPVSSH